MNRTFSYTTILPSLSDSHWSSSAATHIDLRRDSSGPPSKCLTMWMKLNVHLGFFLSYLRCVEPFKCSSYADPGGRGTAKCSCSSYLDPSCPGGYFSITLFLGIFTLEFCLWIVAGLSSPSGNWSWKWPTLPFWWHYSYIDYFKGKKSRFSWEVKNKICLWVKMDGVKIWVISCKAIKIILCTQLLISYIIKA